MSMTNVTPYQHFNIWRNEYIARKRSTGLPLTECTPFLEDYLYFNNYSSPPEFKSAEWETDMFKAYGGLPEIERMFAKD